MAPPRQPCDGEAAWVYDESAAAYAPVVAVEVDPVLARRARAVAEHNGLGSTVTVLEVHR